MVESLRRHHDDGRLRLFKAALENLLIGQLAETGEADLSSLVDQAKAEAGIPDIADGPKILESIGSVVVAALELQEEFDDG